MNATGMGIIVGALTAALVAGSAGWAARDVKFHWFDRPAVVREATAAADAACALRVTTAARVAEQAERARQQAASAEARRFYDEALAVTERLNAAATQQLQSEIADYEAQLAEEGRSCQLTDADLEWLHERRAAGAD